MQDRSITALKEFIPIMRKCRRQLITDILDNSSDLYNFLYQDADKEIRKLFKRRYELKWFENHLNECQRILSAADFSSATKNELLRIFLQWYQKFLSAWGYKPSDAFFFEAEIESLENMIDTNQNWENDLKKLQTNFMRESKILDKQIKEVLSQ